METIPILLSTLLFLGAFCLVPLFIIGIFALVIYLFRKEAG